MTRGAPNRTTMPVISLAADVPPDAARVVLVHGSMDRGRSFRKLTKRLAHLHVRRYDRRGYGASVDLPAARSLDDHVADLEHVVEGRRAVLVGHSFGGVICLALAARRPDLAEAVVAFESPMPWEAWWPTSSAGGDALHALEAGGPEEAAERFMRRTIGDDRWDRLPPAIRTQRRAEGHALVAELSWMRSGLVPYRPEALSVPVIAGRGSASLAHHVRAAGELAARAPRGQLVEVAGAGHGAHRSHPDELAQMVRSAVDAARAIRT